MTNFKLNLRNVAAIAACLAVTMFASCKKNDPPKTVTVATQVGTMTAGETETVTFAVTTENIADGSYTPQVANLPTGVSAQGKVDINANKGTLTLAGSTTTQAGTPDNLTLTIDGATSAAFTLNVKAATYSISANPTTLSFGTLSEGYEQPEAKIVIITNNGTGTVTLNALPAVANYTLGSFSKTSLAAGETATFIVRPNTDLAAETYNREISVTGTGGATAKVNAEFEVTAPIFLLEEKQITNWRYIIEYDDHDRMIKYSSYQINVGAFYEVFTFNYNAAGDLVEQIMEYPNNLKTTFLKNGNKITCIKDNDNNPPVEFELNPQGLLEKITYVNQRDDESGDYYIETASFTWQNGNVTKKVYKEEWKNGVDEGSYSSVVTFTYDEMKSPFYYCKTPKWFLMWFSLEYNVNNIKTEIYDGVTAYTYEYTYNDDGFPVTKKQVGSTFTETYKYKKK